MTKKDFKKLCDYITKQYNEMNLVIRVLHDSHILSREQCDRVVALQLEHKGLVFDKSRE